MEGFIRYAATKSSMGGQSYQVICNEKKMTTAKWLTRELDRFRNREKIPQKGGRNVVFEYHKTDNGGDIGVICIRMRHRFL